jgi:hypothetical protein
MLGWIKTHPVWAGIGFVVFVVVLWMIFGRSSGGGSSGAVVNYTPQQTDQSVVAAGMQVQLAQFAAQAQMQQTDAAAQVALDTNATNLGLANIAAANNLATTTLQADVARAKLVSDSANTQLSTTLAAQIAQAQITASTQQAQIAAHSTDLATQAQADYQTAQAGFNAQMFASTQQTQQQLIASNQAVAQAQIKASKKKICFITTAACEVLGMADDCDELQTLRGFRDGWLVTLPDGPQLVQMYYACAPFVVAAMAEREDKVAIYTALMSEYIRPAVECVKAGENVMAFDLYWGMLQEVSQYDQRVVDCLAIARSRGCFGGVSTKRSAAA